MKTSLGTWRRLQQAADDHGTFTVLAMDHRGPIRRQLAKDPAIGDLDETVAALKRDVVAELAPLASAVLLDPELGWKACVATRTLPGSTGLLIALDTGSTGDPAVLKTGLVEDWSVDRIADAGAAGVKLLVYYHPDTTEAAAVEMLVDEVARACKRREIPLYLEPLSYDPACPAQPLPSAERQHVVVETARRLVPLGVDILKAEFPVRASDTPDEAVWREACLALNEACPVPWVILSAGVSEVVFLRQAAIACEAGASGVIAGRAIWSEAVTSDLAGRRQFLRTLARERLSQVAEICRSTGRPFWDRLEPAS